MNPPTVNVGDIIHVDDSWALCGIMTGNEYEVTVVHAPGFISVTNGAFFSSLKWDDGDRWHNV